MRAVIDTNILVSGLLNPNGPPGRIVDSLRTGQLVPVVDDRILAEYVRVLRRPYFERYFTKTDREHLIEYLTHNSEYTVPTVHCEGLPDPYDAPFLETALTADVPLVTGNQKHFPPEKTGTCRICTPAEFITLFNV
jgi:putative PIN family toxin of toxin-antitoxin system